MIVESIKLKYIDFMTKSTEKQFLSMDFRLNWYIRVMGDEGSRPGLVACLAETPQ